MLILSRRTGESLMVGNDVVITVLDVKGDQVRLGVTAPPATAVHREEIYRKVTAESPGRFRPPKQGGVDARKRR